MKISNKVVILIPARGGSKRIPKKNIKNIAGKPLLKYVVDECLKITSHVYVSTDDSEIQKFLLKHSINMLDRPSELAGDNSKTEEAIEHAIKYIPKKKSIIVVVQPTSPLLKCKYILEGLKKIKNYDSIISVCKDTNYYWSEDGKPINFKIGNRHRTQDKEVWYKENGAFYITRLDNFITTKKLQNGKVGFVEMKASESIDIDDYDDLKIVEAIIKNDKS
jgi:N-acylneuraminate cytidylyltransferase